MKDTLNFCTKPRGYAQGCTSRRGLTAWGHGRYRIDWVRGGGADLPQTPAGGGRLAALLRAAGRALWH